MSQQSTFTMSKYLHKDSSQPVGMVLRPAYSFIQRGCCIWTLGFLITYSTVIALAVMMGPYTFLELFADESVFDYPEVTFRENVLPAFAVICAGVMILGTFFVRYRCSVSGE